MAMCMEKVGITTDYCWLPSSATRRYTQVLEARHFGKDAEIQRPRMANWGHRQMSLQPRTSNYGLACYLNQAFAQPTCYRPGLDFGIPAEMTDFPV